MENITYKKSFAAKLILAGEATLSVYQTLKDACSLHAKVKTRQSFNYETITFGRNKVGVIKIGRKNISLCLALNPQDYEGTKYNFEDASDKKNYQSCPMVLKLKSPRSVKYACELLEAAFTKVGATKLTSAELVDYSSIYYSRSFEELVQQGLIKKYVRTVVDGKKVVIEEKVTMYNVNFNAKLVYEATNSAKDLYIITSYDNWDLSKAVKMTKTSENEFTATMSFPAGTKFEFKICRSNNWSDVEKGIWKEEIVNHFYVIVDKDLYVEDLIHNFRNA